MHQPVRGVVRLPAVQPLGTEAAAVNTISSAAANPNHAVALHADVETTTVRAKHARRLHPALRLLDRILIHARGPVFARAEGRSLTPDVPTPLTRHDNRKRCSAPGGGVNAPCWRPACPLGPAYFFVVEGDEVPDVETVGRGEARFDVAAKVHDGHAG